MRCIDADALEKEGWSLHRTIRVDKNTEEYQTKPLRKVSTIEPRCETCEAFNKTRLLIPQPERKRGEWIKNSPVTMRCNQCGFVIKDWDWHRFKYCPNCGARMEENNESD